MLICAWRVVEEIRREWREKGDVCGCRERKEVERRGEEGRGEKG